MLRALALALATASAAWPQQPPDYTTQSRRLAHLHVDDLVRGWLEATGVPGAAIAIVEGEQTLVLAGYGLADPATGATVDPWRTVFGAGELVRPFTAMALLQLAERGALDLAADITTYLPEPTPGGNFSQPIAADHLLTHTAGFDERWIASRARSPDGILPLAVYLRRFPPFRVRPPGRVSVPSAVGLAVAGRLVETLSDLSFPAYLRRHVFEPLEMSDSAVVLDRSLRPRLATGHRRIAGSDVAVSPEHPHIVAASSLWTTAADMSRWLKALSNDGSVGDRRLLGRQGVSGMLERRFTNHERLPGRSLAFREDRRFSPPVLYQAARGGGYSTVALVIAQRRLGLFAAFNREVEFWGLIDRILGLFTSPAEPRPPPPSPPPEAMLPMAVDGYWRSASLPHTGVEKLVSLIRQERIRQLAQGELTWRSRRYRAIAPLAFQQVDGARLLCLVADGEDATFAATADAVLERLRWFETWPVQVALWLLFAAGFLAAASSSGSMSLRSRVFALPSGMSPAWPTLLARLAAAINFLFIVLVAVLLAAVTLRGAQPLLYGVPWPLFLLLALPLLAAALTVATAVTLALAWPSRWWTRRQRLRMLLLTAALAVFPAFLNGWGLLGFRF